MKRIASLNLHDLMVVITDMGDSALLAAIVLAMAGCFLVSRCYREAASIFLAFVLAGSVIATLKLGFLSCGGGILDIRSPSGHTALSIAVFGTYAMLIGHALPRWLRLLLPAALVLLAIAISVTRVLLGMHTTAEVVAGMTVGAAAIGVVRLTAFRKGPTVTDGKARFRILTLIASTVAAIILVYGIKLPAETMIRELAQAIQAHVPACH